MRVQFGDRELTIESTHDMPYALDMPQMANLQTPQILRGLKAQPGKAS